MTMPVERTWQCKCGEFKIKLTGEPGVLLDCPCHSCVSAARFINEKHKGTGASALKGNPEQVAAAVFSAGQCEFLTDLSSEDGTSKLNYALVGEDGKFFRSYVRCCGTQLTNSLFPKGIGLTRNNIVEKDGSAYEPKEDVTSVQSGNGFVEKSLIPDPKHDSYPLLMMVRFAATTQNPFGKSFEQKELYPVRSEAEIVPVTWECNCKSCLLKQPQQEQCRGRSRSMSQKSLVGPRARFFKEN